MKTTLHIFHNPDLYEVTFQGTMVYLIQRFPEGSTSGRVVGFANLPDDVKNKIVQAVRKQQKKGLGWVDVRLLIILTILTIYLIYKLL